MIAYVTIPILIAAGLVNYKQTWYFVSAFWLIAINVLYVTFVYFQFMFEDWKSGDKPKEKAHAIPNLNAIPESKGFSLTSVGVKIDPVRMFNRTLIEMRNGNLEVKMTEAFWIAEKVDGESRWNRIGGAGRSDFIEMLDRGIKFGAYKTVGGQNKRVPDDWRKIRALEQGAPLPQ